MKLKFAKRMSYIKASEIREILKVTEREDVISFAGGLPAPELFPIDEINKMNQVVLQEAGAKALQYTTTEGYYPLREWIAKRMNERLGTSFDKDNILITHGSQQGLDLSGKVFLDDGLERRKKLAELSALYDIPVIEDNPYGELRFEGESLPSIKSFDKVGNILCTGSFSKIFCPGFRIGWIAGDKDIIRKYVLVKQGTDLQCNTIAQMTIAEYLKRYDIDEHISKIVEVYRKRRDIALECIERYFPNDIKYTHPQGGLFTWIELPENISARDILQKCIEQKIAFVPGGSFYPVEHKENTFRINYSNMPEDRIMKGLQVIGEVLKEYIYQLK